MSSLSRCLVCGLLLAATSVGAQNIRSHYVSKAEEDGTIYHTFPQTLFENKKYGELTFDLTYKERLQGLVTFNFTYSMPRMTPADSVRISSGDRVLTTGPVQRLYTEPGRKEWKHRYTLRVPVEAFGLFFDSETSPELTIYSGGQAYVYPAKRSAWRSYAPVGCRIFEMIRVNEAH